jgi:ankyrin repeat protein
MATDTSATPLNHTHNLVFVLFVNFLSFQLNLDEEMIRLLLMRGADVNAPGGKGNTPLHFALMAVEAIEATNKQTQLQQQQQQQQKQQQQHRQHVVEDMSTEKDMKAPKMGVKQEAVIRRLLEHGAISSISNEDGFSPFITAVMLHKWDIVNIMIDEESARNVSSEHKGRTLHSLSCLVVNTNKLFIGLHVHKIGN